MSIKYHVRLTDDERKMLEALIKQEKPKVVQHKKRRVGILLAIDENQSPLTHEQIAKAFLVRLVTICRLRRRLVEEGIEAAVNGKHAGNSHKRKLDGEGQAHIIVIACSHQVKELVDGRYKEADKVVLVQGNLNTHAPASLYKAFSPEEAHRIANKLEFHYTPKNGSWLDMAEIELSILSRQCLNCRIPDQNTLRREVKAWEE